MCVEGELKMNQHSALTCCVSNFSPLCCGVSSAPQEYVAVRSFNAFWFFPLANLLMLFNGRIAHD